MIRGESSGDFYVWKYQFEVRAYFAKLMSTFPFPFKRIEILEEHFPTPCIQYGDFCRYSMGFAWEKPI